MTSENNNAWRLPAPEENLSTGEENYMYFNQTSEDGPLPKRWKASPSSDTTTTQQSRLSNNELQILQSQYDPLNEPSPLGLRLRKSPSLLELAQKRLNQVNADKGNLPVENTESGTTRDSRARAKAKASGSNDRLKASHFPALLLRIGNWEYVSKHEGDLVAKCYFSKHKIVWEVLDGGLKKKFEMNWADIKALKANCAADGLGTLTIVLEKQPHFFKETNPQPRKHTQWRATSDFTNGEASTHRQHFLEFSEGVLDKHYEKLIQCDPRLQLLSQQQDIVSNFPYFRAKASVKDQNISGNRGFNLPEMYNIMHMASPTLQTSSFQTVESGSLGLIHQDMSKEAYSSSSGMSMDIDGQNVTEQLMAPCLQQTMSISNLVNHIGSSLPVQNMSENLPFSNNVQGLDIPNEMLENISQILLSDNNSTTASDERTLMSRVNSLCCILQDYQNGQQDGNQLPDPYTNDDSTLDSILLPENKTQEDGNNNNNNNNDNSLSTMFPQDYPISQQVGNGSSTPGYSQMPQKDGNDSLMSENETEQDNNASGSNQESGMSRKDSFSDLLHQLPRIASLPKFLFEISENGEILK